MSKLHYPLMDIPGILQLVMSQILDQFSILAYLAAGGNLDRRTISFNALAAYIKQLKDPIGPILSDLGLSIWKTMEYLKSVDEYNGHKSTVSNVEIQQYRAAKVYRELIKEPPPPSPDGLMRLYAYLDDLPYSVYLLCRIAAQAELDTDLAFKDDGRGYDLHSGYHDFLTMRKPEAYYFYDLTQRIWWGCDQMVFLFTGEVQ